MIKMDLPMPTMYIIYKTENNNLKYNMRWAEES